MSLAKRAEEYGIPPIPYLPIGHNVLVFRLPEEERSAGGLYLAESTREQKHAGVLVSAGLAALDVLADHLVDIGDVVWFGKYAGHDEEVQRDPAGKGKRIISMKCEDILGSVDALERVKSYNIERNVDDEFIYVKRAA